MKRGRKLGSPRKGHRPANGCGDCRWWSASVNLPKTGRCMLDPSNTDVCRFYGTTAQWESVVESPGARHRDPDGGLLRAEEAERRRYVTEIQIQRLGYSRYCLAEAAHVLHKMPKGSLPRGLLQTLREIEDTLLALSDQLYKLQGQAFIRVRGVA